MDLSLPLSFFILVSLSYIIGSIPFALITGFILNGKDIRKEGSGNAGATNVLRVLGWKAAVFVLVADFLKGFLIIFYAYPLLKIINSSFQYDLLIIEALKITMLLFIIVGHAFPIWAGFKGGKGVACSAGGLSALVPIIAPFCLIVFISVILISRYVSLASLITAWFMPLLYIFITRITSLFFTPLILAFLLLITVGITILHRKNIKRLFKGEETKIKFRNK